MRAHPWATSPLGPPESWPQSLRSVVGLLLHSKFAMFVVWGDELCLLYNDPYAVILGDKHPRALGARFDHVWAEIWSDIAPLVDAALTGEATYHDDLPLLLNRRSFDEQAWFTFSYSPVRDESGRVAGLFCAVAETTAKVLSERRTLAERGRLERMFEQAPGFMALLSGPDPRFELVNPAFRQLIGHRDVVGRTVAEALPDAVEQGYLDHMRQAFRSGEAMNFANAPYDVQAVPGGPIARRLIDFVYQPIRAPGGAVAGLFVEGYDVTDRVRAEQALRERQEEQRFLIELENRVRALSDPGTIMAEVARALGERLGATGVAFVELVEAEGRGIVQGQWTEPGVAELPGEFRLGDTGTALADCVRGGTTLAARDVRTDPRTCDHAAELERGGIRSLVIAPLVWHGDCARHLHVHQPIPRDWTDPDLKLIGTLAERGWEAVERARAEAALRSSEERFRQFGEAAADTLWIADAATGRIEYLSPAYERVWGEPRGPVMADIGRWATLVHPDDRASAAACMPRLLAGETVTTEYRIVRPDGHVRWIADVGFPIRDAAGRVVRVAGIAQDLTDRREAAARFEGVFNSGLMGFAILDAAGGEVVAINERLLEMIGHSRADVAEGRWDWRAVVTADRSQPDPGGAAQPGWGKPFETQIRHTSGAVLPVRIASAPLPGLPDQVVVSVEDIADRRAAEERLRDLNDTLEQQVTERTAALLESRRRFQAIFDSALQFMALLTPQGVVVEINQTALRWSEIEPGAVVGKPFWQAPPMRDNPALQAAIRDGIARAAAGDTVREEHEMRGAGEVRAMVDFSLKPMLGGRGETLWLVAEGRDITALKQAQEALRQAQKMEAMGQLTGGVAHDFNNLLTPIVGALDMLQRKGVGGDRELRLIDGAAQSAERARTLVQRLLAFARRQPLQSSSIDLRDLTGGMAELIASTTGPQIRVVVDAPDALPPARVDPNQLEMAILNLAVNARDAMPDGGTLRITLGAEVVERQHPTGLWPGGYVRLSVADTGTGMDETTLARAIEPFFSTKGIGKGTGLGLSMVHGLATQLGGALTIRSTPGVGTNVELWLPQAESPQAAQPQAGAGCAAAARGRGSVLLVDDEDLVRLSTADMLAELGYEVTEAASGDEALRLLDTGFEPDLLVTDHLMPGMTGAELAARTRAVRPATKVLVVSGYADVEGIAPDLPRLTKPFRNAELAASLAALG